MNTERDHRPGVVLVTGGSRGIGAAIARLAATRGYAVGVNYTSDESGARSVVAEVTGAGGHAVAMRGDVSVEAEVAAVFDRLESELGGPLTALVNNAGITGGFSRVEVLKAETLRRVLAVNVVGTVLCGREAVRRMSLRRGGAGGSIVNVSSLAARLGGAGEWVHYAASKGAVETFTRGLAREVAAEGIRVNAVSPGLIETDLHAAAGAPDRLALLGPGVPAGRAGTAEEVAEAVLWLLSGAASYVTGSILEVGGGR